MSRLFLALLAGLILFGCTGPALSTRISGTHALVLNEDELQQLGMELNDCRTEESTDIAASPVQYTMCNYSVRSLNDTEIIIELKKFTNREALENAYQYESSHLYSVEGLISENEYGDKSRFRVNHPSDYMGHLNEPGVYYYHLWICKNEYLIHITSKGRSADAASLVSTIGRLILSKFS